MGLTLADATNAAVSRQPATLTVHGVTADGLPAPKVDRHVLLAVENLNCGGCMRKIERVLAGQPGITSARVNLTAKRVSVCLPSGGLSTEAIIALLSGAGFRAAELANGPAEGHETASRDMFRRLAVAGFATANIMLLSVSVWASSPVDMTAETRQLFHWLSALIALPAVAYAGQPFFRSAAAALRVGQLNMDVPISLALVLASAMSVFQTWKGTDHVYFDASVSLVFFLLIGRVLDQTLRSRATGAAENLLGLKAGFATLLAADGTTQRVAARMIEPGMRLLVATGERIAADGHIVKGRTDLDEQLITGETVPRVAGEGDRVYSGTIALNAPIERVASATADDPLLSEIARLMQAAEQNRSAYVRLADRIAGYYAPVVHVLGAATFVGWLVAGAGVETSLTSAIAVLIITCPCALALAVPAVQVAAVSRLFGRGVIITAADGLERMAEVDTLVLDKTGTLTMGDPTLRNGAALTDAVLQDAASLAVNSRHPYARAVVRAASERGLAVTAADNVGEVPGCGLVRHQGREDEQRLGSAVWVLGEPADSANGECTSPAQTSDPASELWFRTALAAEPVSLRFEDTLRRDARAVVTAARRCALDVILLSGDREPTVRHAAEQAGITRWFAGQRPDQKIAVLAALKAEGHRVLMVGDGLNDAPALAAAHASLTMSNAVAVSQVASDGIVQGEGLGGVIEAITVARAARRYSLSNFAIAAGYNLIFIPVAMVGLVTPLIAALAMSASSILVTANALRLRSARLGLGSQAGIRPGPVEGQS